MKKFLVKIGLIFGVFYYVSIIPFVWVYFYAPFLSPLAGLYAWKHQFSAGDLIDSGDYRGEVWTLLHILDGIIYGVIIAYIIYLYKNRSKNN